ncbi:MAG: acyl-CoA dehydrogenase family protein [Candidatus Rokubacteria bacterium]|nr:acyl-CoA dehydrogenase family protein [Candidatus Rokubacteria bacterium]
MTYALDDDHRQLQDLIRRVARERVAPRAAEIDRSAQYPQDMFDLLRELRLFTLPFPAEYGGTGGMLSACLAVEELGRACYNTAYLLIVQWTPFGAILAGGTEEQKKRLLPGLAAGDLRAAISVTEAQSGSDVAGIRTRARRIDGGYRLNGSKVWCTGAPVADFILVAAKTGEDDTPGSVNLFIIERGAKGFEIGRPEDKMGARGIPSCPLFLDDVFVPESSRLGDEGRGFKIVMEAFNTARPIMGARGVGLAQGAIDHAVEFVQNRVAFGRTVADFQGVRWMLADMAMQTEAARHLVYRAAALVDQGVSGPALAPVAAMAKCFATDTAMTVATNAVQLFGAAGISAEFPINRYMRDAKVLQIIEGTNQIQRNIIANALLGRARSR